MSLNDRLKALQNPGLVESQASMASDAPDLLGHIHFESEPVDHSASSAGSSDRGDGYTPEGPAATLFFEQPKPAAAAVPDALAPVKEKAAEELFGRIGSRLSDANLTEQQLHDIARAELADIVAGEQLALSTSERNRLIDEIGADVLGYGPLENLLADPSITEIMVNRHDQIFVERHGRLYESSLRFTGEPQLRRVIERIVAKVGRRIDESSPLVDARLEDGSRVNAIIPPLAVNGASSQFESSRAPPSRPPI